MTKVKYNKNNILYHQKYISIVLYGILSIEPILDYYLLLFIYILLLFIPLFICIYDLMINITIICSVTMWQMWQKSIKTYKVKRKWSGIMKYLCQTAILTKSENSWRKYKISSRKGIFVICVILSYIHLKIALFYI